MLAIQRLGRMGSSQPNERNVAFGYSLEPNQEPDLFFDVPEPPPGAPLLSDNETKALSSFFDGIRSDQYNLDSYGEGLNFGDVWFQELPPTFMGTTTSFGQQPPPSLASSSQAMPHGDFHDLMPLPTSLMPPPPPPSAPQAPLGQSILEQHPSADVLAAAAQLLQNGSAQRSNSLNGEPIFVQRGMTQSLGPPVGHLRHQPLEDFKQDGRRGLTAAELSGEHDNHFADMFFGSSERQITPRANPSTDLQWGSDSRFGQNPSYVPPEKETYESLSKAQHRYMECLEPSTSAADTRPSTPLTGDQSQIKSHSRKTSDLYGGDVDADAPPRKRRKSKPVKSDDEDEEEFVAAGKSNRKRRSKVDGIAGSQSPPRQNGTTSRRRKSSTSTKPPPSRENLSEEQKRENHIRSEQKRRTFIKEGYDDLCEIVPGLKNGNFSKSTMLGMAADWLDDLLQGNDVLKAQLAALEGR